jgi:hypothetical protein
MALCDKDYRPISQLWFIYSMHTDEITKTIKLAYLYVALKWSLFTSQGIYALFRRGASNEARGMKQ